MSDIPPADQPQGTPGRRATRPRSRSSAARRARSRKPFMALGAEDTAENQEEAALAEALQDDELPTGDLETTLSDARGDASASPLRRLTSLSRQILLWGAIVG